jgi:hypothetical protein
MTSQSALMVFNCTRKMGKRQAGSLYYIAFVLVREFADVPLADIHRTVNLDVA